MTPRDAIWQYAIVSGLASIAFDAAGRARATRKPKGRPVVWTSFSGARKIARMINRQRAGSSADIRAAARACRVKIIPHAEVARQAVAATKAVDTALETAKRVGVLKQVNQGYLTHRQAAEARSERALPYGRIMTRLRRELLAHAIRGETLPPIEALVETVLPGRSSGG